ncbi:Bug family tripartite tricarboxylate transporter substrate binding protein [Achromobacter marplatensis]|uniref:Tripartite tricarboxylate transporter substrate binding protein n=1 Tax=Achromobacter marplatensis TaxID=470868 RepID=A0AA42W6X3_9BURK|nr:tripartite tricarboxylate transporter substrate binding protein [Achromobacter marplatensis]MDH2049738.1 tripartite tricarboxylate transporter substrate binding protein [Achromobacter marplatensis]
MKKNLMIAAVSLLTGLGVGAHAQAQAQDYPARPVSLLVPYPAGAASDITARAVQAPMSQSLGVQVVVENLGGANGALGANRVLNAKADGYTLFQGSPNELILAGLTNKSVTYKPDDFQFVAPVATSPYVVVTRADLGAANVDELVALARQRSVPLTYGSGGAGSMIHLITAALAERTGVALTHIPYRGGAPLITDMAGGQIDFAIMPYQANYEDLRREGRLKIIGTLNRERLAALPDVPSVQESATLKDFNYTIWTAYLVKKGTPAAAVQKLHTAIQASLRDPAARKTLEAQGKILFAPQTLAEGDAFYTEQIAGLADLVQRSGFRGD